MATDGAVTKEDLAQAMRRGVGPVLQSGPLANAVIAAIEEENAEVFVEDRGAYLRVFVPDACRVSRTSIEACLGRELRFPGELEVIMSSFAGRMALSAEGAEWAFAGAVTETETETEA